MKERKTRGLKGERRSKASAERVEETKKQARALAGFMWGVHALAG
jgi:hypothetical protein